MGLHRAPRRVALTALRLSLAAVIVTALAAALPTAAPGPPATVAATPLPPPVMLDAAAPVRGAAPTRVRIPSVSLDSSLARLGLDATGALTPPSNFARAGWYSKGPAPGEIGPAVIAGHVDSYTGPAVFFRLAQVAVGSEVLVGRSDGTTLRFTVTRVARYPKTAFPSAEVYGPTPTAELRLITCGGQFDRSRRSYVDNVVVFARLSGPDAG
jgi:hypothetical protein